MVSIHIFDNRYGSTLKKMLLKDLIDAIIIAPIVNKYILN